MGDKSNAAFVIDFQDPRLLRAIDAWDLIGFLDTYHVDYSLSGKNIGRNYIGVIPCPYCGDSRNHFGIHKEHKHGNCFSCGRKSHPLKIVSFFGRMSMEKAFKLMISMAEETGDVQTRVNDIFHVSKKTYDARPLQTDPLPLSRQITLQDLQVSKPLHDFFIERRLTIWHAKRFDLRISMDPKRKGYIIFPLMIKNKPVSYQMRAITFKKYHAADHLEQYLFNEDRIVNGQPLILVEGFLDMTRIDTYITCCYPNRIQVVTGGLKSISAMQRSRLTKYKPNPLIVMFDNDSWFNYSNIQNSMPYNVDYVILPKGCDPSSLTWNQMETVFKKEIERYICH
jgi:hypothetical protein